MSGYRFPYQPKFFKDDLEYKNQIREQQAEVRKALNYGTKTDIANTVETYRLLVTDKMIPKDDKFNELISDLDQELNLFFEEKTKSYEAEASESLCADVIDKPDKTKNTPRWYFESKFSILNNFFDRLGLGLEHEREGYF